VKTIIDLVRRNVMRSDQAVRVAGVAAAVAVMALVWPPPAVSQPTVLAVRETMQNTAGAHLGISIRDVTGDDVAKMKLQGQSGVVVEDVSKGSAAEKAGLKAGDVIVQYDGESVRSAAQLTRLVRESVPGRPVKIGVIRDGKRVDLEATPAKAQGERVWIDDTALRHRIDDQMRTLQDRMEEFRRQDRRPGISIVVTDRVRIGIGVQSLTPDLAAYFGVKGGALVASVEQDSRAARAGIKAGDVITSIDGTSVEGPNDVVRLLRDKDGQVSIGLVRDRKALTVTVK
jgi:serine protease Do